MDQERQRLLARYRQVTCEFFSAGAWRPWTARPDSDLIAVSAWNPEGRALGEVENAQRDRRLRRHLQGLGLHPLRVRGYREGEPPEEGWMIPHDLQRSLGILREFMQLAGLVYGRDARSVLWADGSLDGLDGPPPGMAGAGR